MENIQEIKISKLEVNKGQVEGLPKNPRFIRDERYKALVKSIEDAPEMLKLRELLVVEHGSKFVVIGGNMRLRACKELGMETVPCKVLPADTPVAKLREYAIKDNNGFGEDDWDVLANEWDAEELQDWGMELPMDWGVESSEDEIERKAREFQERMEAGEIDEDDEEYQEFLEKFKLKKTTDDCYTPAVVYEAVANWVSETYRIDRKHFERPFYPGGDYQNADYPKGCVVVDNPPFSILAEILQFYTKKGIKFFLFAPSLTLFSSSSSTCTALPVGVAITYENGANVATSFLTNLEPKNIRLRSAPTLYAAVKAANDENLKEMHKELPKYSYPDYIVMSTRVAQYSHYGIDFVVPVDESQPISQLDSQKPSGKAIYGKGYIVSERVKAAKEKAEREKAEREKAEREKAEREKAEREKAEREKAERWELSQREMEIVKSLSRGKDDG